MRNKRSDTSHELVLELAAASALEELSPEEETLVLEHVAVCSACAQAAKEFKLIADYGRALPQVIHQADSPEGLWDPITQKQRLLARVHSQQEDDSLSWKSMKWCAAAVLIIAASVLVGYQLGSRSEGQPMTIAAVAPQGQPSASGSPESRREETALELERAQAEERAKSAEQKIPQLEAELGKLEATRMELLAKQRELEVQVRTGQTALQLASAEKKDVVQSLGQTEKLLRTAQQELGELREQRSRDLLHAANAEFRLQQVSSELNRKDQTIARQQQLLESDRDIRELMGARQLRIADIVDVDKNGRNRKPFGRVFYTKGKSLLFYAFDLDQQSGIRDAKVFQAWGYSDTSSNTAVSLGIFYLDNETNHRWVVKTDDADLLSKLDAVFVTVEKNGKSKKPTGKPFLYTYLRKGEPNHP